MILLDTCTLLWLVMEPSKLSETAKSALRNHAGKLQISAITAFEIGQKYAAGKLELPFPPPEWFDRSCLAHGLKPVEITPKHAFTAAALPFHHRDPFDRLLIATAHLQHCQLLTPDPLIRQYAEITTIW